MTKRSQWMRYVEDFTHDLSRRQYWHWRLDPNMLSVGASIVGYENDLTLYAAEHWAMTDGMNGRYPLLTTAELGRLTTGSGFVPYVGENGDD